MLEHLVAQDEECKLLTVGAWYAMTGYAAAFPRNSRHFDSFNRKIMDYSENGELAGHCAGFSRGAPSGQMSEEKLVGGLLGLTSLIIPKKLLTSNNQN